MAKISYTQQIKTSREVLLPMVPSNRPITILW